MITLGLHPALTLYRNPRAFGDGLPWVPSLICLPRPSSHRRGTGVKVDETVWALCAPCESGGFGQTSKERNAVSCTFQVSTPP